MDYWERKLTEASLDDPHDTLRKDKAIFKKLREENANLKEEVRRLSKNNEKLVKLAEIMEDKIKKLTEEIKKNYVYSYEKGGWIEKKAMDRSKVEVAPSQLSVDTINNQLAEILRMIKNYKVKE